MSKKKKKSFKDINIDTKDTVLSEETIEDLDKETGTEASPEFRS